MITMLNALHFFKGFNSVRWFFYGYHSTKGITKSTLLSNNCFEQIDVHWERGPEKNALPNVYLKGWPRDRAQYHQCMNFFRHLSFKLYYIVQIIQTWLLHLKMIIDNRLWI